MSQQDAQSSMRVTVDSFSELPFIRALPAAENTSNGSSAAIRLFGIDFPTEPDASSQDGSFNDPPSTTETSNTLQSAANAIANTDSGESAKKFECHYCCRKFPTSQALGGHQNAHKRERQHAKRAHLHSSMAGQHYHHPSFVYGYLNYRNLCSVPSTARFDHPPPPYYPSWTTTAPTINPVARFYGGFGSSSQPVNGSPIPELWRMPVHGCTASFPEDYPPALPSFGGRDTKEAAVEGGGGTVGFCSSSSSSLASQKDQGGLDSASKNGLSLDLRL